MSALPPIPTANSTANHPLAILQFVADNPDAALCVLTDVTGGTLRQRGAMMAVTADHHVGYISNGCVDGDIIFQARAAILAQAPRTLRYGDGSPFKDITLPCGGAIEIVVLPKPDRGIIKSTLVQLLARQTASFSINNVGELSDALPSGGAPDLFSCVYSPPIKLRIAGRGEAALQLAFQGRAAGFDILLQSPDIEILNSISGAKTHHLKDIDCPPETVDDSWTAVALMFHDHDWEMALLKQAMAGPAFYIGAMGSQKTHDQRKARLKSAGTSDIDIERIQGPIGLIPAMRDANLLALSVLAQIVSAAQTQGNLS